MVKRLSAADDNPIDPEASTSDQKSIDHLPAEIILNRRARMMSTSRVDRSSHRLTAGALVSAHTARTVSNTAVGQFATGQTTGSLSLNDFSHNSVPTVATDSPSSQPLQDHNPSRLTRNPAAVALGRLGGLKGGRARANALSKSELSDAARKAALARWGKRKQG